jgi:hypothetical protein
MSNFTIGADPEFMLKNYQGQLISAIGKIGGDKWNPKPISEVGHAILEDNVSVEFNIPPSDNADAFVAHLSFVMQHLRGVADSHGLLFAEGVASASFPETELQTPEALVFGCEPDFNAWTEQVNPKPKSDDPNLRSCGGHVHIGTSLDPIKVIRACDLFLGVPSVWMDSDSKRRELYGKAGAFRPKPYGVEYRTLSNFWIWSEKHMRWVYDQTNKALDFVEQGNEIDPEMGKLVCQAINQGDLSAAKYLGESYPAIL